MARPSTLTRNTSVLEPSNARELDGCVGSVGRRTHDRGVGARGRNARPSRGQMNEHRAARGRRDPRPHVLRVRNRPRSRVPGERLARNQTAFKLARLRCGNLRGPRHLGRRSRMQRSVTPHAMSPRRRILWVFSALLIGVAISVVMIELGLQVASRFSDGREILSPDGAAIRILAVGDSHTRGALVPAKESYPAHLQVFLDQAMEGRYSVANLGLSGMSTTQVLNRLSNNVDRHQPDIVIIWCGVNNSWNDSERDSLATRSPSVVDSIARSSRLIRLIRVFRHHWELSRNARTRLIRMDGVHQKEKRKKFDDDQLVYEIDHGQGVETITHRGNSKPSDANEVEERAYQDYRAMIEWLDTSETRVILIQYPLWAGAFGAANRAMGRVAQQSDLTLIDTQTAIDRVPKEEIEWLWGAHPNGRMYREIARDVAAAVLSGDSHRPGD